MGTVQQGLFPCLDESLPNPMTEPDKGLIKILDLVQFEQYVLVNRRRQWLGQPVKEPEAMPHAFSQNAAL